MNAVAFRYEPYKKGFNQYFNQTPIEFIRDQRLELIHLQLQLGSSDETVTDIVEKWH